MVFVSKIVYVGIRSDKGFEYIGSRRLLWLAIIYLDTKSDIQGIVINVLETGTLRFSYIEYLPF